MQRAKAMKRKIAFLLPDMSGGGAERVALTLIREFIGRGHDVDLLLAEAKGELLPLVPDGVRVLNLKARRLRSALWPLVRYLREQRPDTLQVSMWPLTIIGIIARMISRSRTRLVVSDHAVLSDHYPRARHGIISVTVRLFYPRADARVIVSNGAARDLAGLANLPANCFTVIRNPIDFPAEIARRPEIEALWESSGKRILTLGQLKEEKSQDLLIRAFAQLPKELDARLMIVGSGPRRSMLEELAKELDAADRIVFAGYANDPWPYYASADLFVLPSREESFGNVLVEALYAGLPVVSTRSLGAAEVLDDGRYGRLTPVGDVEALAGAMRAAVWQGRATSFSGYARSLVADSVKRYEDIMLGDRP